MPTTSVGLRRFAKSVYMSLPLKQEIFSLLRKYWTPPSSVYRHMYFRGVFEVPVDGASFKIHHYGYDVENTIFWAGLLGSWEKISMQAWIPLCRQSTVIFDI